MRKLGQSEFFEVALVEISFLKNALTNFFQIQLLLSLKKVNT